MNSYSCLIRVNNFIVCVKLTLVSKEKRFGQRWGPFERKHFHGSEQKQWLSRCMQRDSKHSATLSFYCTHSLFPRWEMGRLSHKYHLKRQRSAHSESSKSKSPRNDSAAVHLSPFCENVPTRGIDRIRIERDSYHQFSSPLSSLYNPFGLWPAGRA